MVVHWQVVSFHGVWTGSEGKRSLTYSTDVCIRILKLKRTSRKKNPAILSSHTHITVIANNNNTITKKEKSSDSNKFGGEDNI